MWQVTRLVMPERRAAFRSSPGLFRSNEKGSGVRPILQRWAKLLWQDRLAISRSFRMLDVDEAVFHVNIFDPELNRFRNSKACSVQKTCQK